MGNLCYVEELDQNDDKLQLSFQKKLNQFNNNLLSQIQNQDIIIFQKNVVAQLIVSVRAPKQLSIVENNAETKLEFCQRIKLEIQQNQQSLFNLLIANYFLHFNEIYAEEEVVDILQQFDTITQMLRYIILSSFAYDLKLYFGNDLDKLPEKEMLVQRVLQHYLLGKTSPIKQKFNTLLKLYYQHLSEEQLSRSNIPEKGTVLEQNDFEIDQALIPNVGEEVINISNDSFLESSGGSVKQSAQSSIDEKQIIQIIQNSQKQYQNLPYFKTFEILTQMVNTTKPWKKFLLIEKFDNLITKIFLTNRDTDQINSLQEILFAEDSRSDIYLYIFHQFCQQYTINYKEHLLNSLKLMWEFDGLLCSDIYQCFGNVCSIQ